MKSICTKCGAEFERTDAQVRRRTKNCYPCLNANWNAKRKAAVAARGNRRTKHGMSHSKIHRVWASMKARCQSPTHPAYRHYGARGITVCPQWQTFDGFYADMGDPPPGTSLDRIDNDKGYCPDNCRWATSTQQARNSRWNVYITFNGSTKCVSEWASDYGISLSTLFYRVSAGWPIQEALTTKSVPPKFRRNRFLAGTSAT